MKSIIETRIIHWKKQWFSILFWLLLPVIATFGITKATDAFQDDSKVPVGIVLEEQTDATMELFDEIQATPFIRVYQLNKNEALHKLKKHELDSVFVVHEGYEEEIRDGSRNRLITSYQSDLSFAYTPVKEMVISYVQQETGRSKSAYFVQDLTKQYQTNRQYSWEQIVEKSKEIQDEENLLDTSFSFADTPLETDKEPRLVSMWGLWAVFSILSTLLLFDWIIKEKQASVIIRFPFMRYSLKSYMITNFTLYSVILLITDLLTASVLYTIFEESINILSLVSFRIMINIAAFLLANQFKQTFLYFTISFAITLFIAISSGSVIPTSGITAKWQWLDMVNPIHPFLAGEVVNLWFFFVIISAVIWLVRKENINA